MGQMKNKKPAYLLAIEKQFKKIWDILCDPQFVQFRLSIKWQRRSGRPREVSIEGQRSADGRWDTHFPQDGGLRAHKSPAVLRERFAKIEQSVRSYIIKNALSVQWNELEKSIEAALQSGLPVDEFLCSTDLPIRGSAAYGYAAHFAAPIIATAYAMAGTRALADGDVSRASHWSGIGLYWSSPKMLIPNPGNRFKKRASTGGKGKARRYEPIKDKVAELLVVLAPGEGWKSLSKAVDKVAIELIDKYSELCEECGLTSVDPAGTIRGWIQKDPTRFPCRIRPSV